MNKLPAKRVLFLDIDGVMNSAWSFENIGRSWPGKEANFLPRALELLQRLVKDYGFHIVISSTWRKHISLDEFARILNIPREVILGATPELDSIRGLDIRHWIEHCEPGILAPDCEFVIVDDDCDMLPEQMRFFVQTLFFANSKDGSQEGLDELAFTRILEVIGEYPAEYENE